MKGIIQGITVRKKEDGKVACMLYLTGVKFTDYDLTADKCEGLKVESVYIPRVVDCNIGDTAIISYGQSPNGMAILEDIDIIPKK